MTHSSCQQACWDGGFANHTAPLRPLAQRHSLTAIQHARKACGVGPGLVFAARLLRDGAAARIGLVPCAVGGTEMDRWMPDADLYEHMVRPCTPCHAQCLAELVSTCMGAWWPYPGHVHHCIP